MNSADGTIHFNLSFSQNSIYLRVRLRERFVNPQFRELFIDGAVPKVMSVALIELVEMTATLKIVVSINSTTVMQTYWTAP